MHSEVSVKGYGGQPIGMDVFVSDITWEGMEGCQWRLFEAHFDGTIPTCARWLAKNGWFVHVCYGVHEKDSGQHIITDEMYCKYYVWSDAAVTKACI
jgi:hypothetical protein